MLTRFETCFIFLAQVLGANIFKKYWIVKGSYWNNTHMSKKSTYDLKMVIEESNTYTLQHINALITQFILYVASFFTDSLLLYQPIFYIFLPIHIYAFLIHHYNRILARNALKELDKQPPIKEIVKEPLISDSSPNIKEEFDNDSHLLIVEKLKDPKGEFIYLLELPYRFGSIKKVYFNNVTDCIAFRNYVYSLGNDYVAVLNLLNETSIIVLWERWLALNAKQ